MSLSDSTLLGLELIAGGFELPEFAAGGIQMTMSPITAAANMQRDVNGNLVNLNEGVTAFQKYAFSLACDDMDSPALAEVSSARDGIWPGASFNLTTIERLGATEQQTFTVMLLSWTVTRDEWGAATSWSAEFEQV